MPEFEYRIPVIPQLNFKNISFERCQIQESASLNYHNLNLQHMLIQEYKQVLPQADRGCGCPKYIDILNILTIISKSSRLIYQNFSTY